MNFPQARRFANPYATDAPATKGCGRADHISRRTLVQPAGASGIAWLTPLAGILAKAAENKGRRQPARSVIVLWLAGVPSQLETFDPHPDTTIAAGTRGIPTTVRDVQLAEGLEQVADQMHSISLIRSVVSEEGDHERAAYDMKTGYRPDSTVTHPSLGALVCHQILQGEAQNPTPRFDPARPVAGPRRILGK